MRGLEPLLQIAPARVRSGLSGRGRGAEGQPLLAAQLALLELLAHLQEPLVATRRGPGRHLQKVAALEGIRGVLPQGNGSAAELLRQQLEPLAHRGRGLEGLAGAFIAAAPTEQQVLPRREQRLQQDIAVLIAAVGIAQLAALLHQVEARPLALAREGPGVQSHQHHHPVGDRSHRLQGTDGQGSRAVTKAAAALAEPLRQDIRHHRCRQLERAFAGHRLPVRQGGMDRLQLPGPAAAVAKEQR